MHGKIWRRIAARRQAFAVALIATTALSFTTSTWGVSIPNHVRDVIVHPSEGEVELEIVGTSAPVFQVRSQNEGKGDGKRVFIELSNADVAGAPAAITGADARGGKGLIGGVLTQAYRTSAGNVTRLVVNLSRDATYTARVSGTTLRVTFTAAAKGGTSTKLGTSASGSSEPASTKLGAPASGSSEPASAKQVSPATKRVNDVRFEQVPATKRVNDVRFEQVPATAGATRCATGCDRVIVGVAIPPSYRVTTSPAGHPRLELQATSVPDALVRTLDVSAYRGPLRSITTFYDAARSLTIVEVEGAGDAPGDVIAESGQLAWVFERNGTSSSPSKKQSVNAPSSGGGATSESAGSQAQRRVVTVAREAPTPNLPKVETSIRSEATGSSNSDMRIETSGGGEAGFTSTVRAQAAGGAAGAPKPDPLSGRYSGRRIDLDLKDADIHNILRLLADVGHVNIVTADDVAGSITIRMRNVPWDQALDVVLQAKSLGMVRQGNLVRVAPMAQLQKERELKIAQQKQEYELAPLETRLIPVSYATADELKARASELLSPRGSIATDERTNVLIARDIAGNLNHIEELIHSLDTQTPQVLVEARIVEATSRYLRDIGIQWGGDATFSEATGNPTGLAFPSRTTIAGGASDPTTPTAGLSPVQRVLPQPNFAVNLPAAAGTGQGGALGFSFGSIDNNFNVNLRLSAAETTGMVRIVSSPRVLTLDNREARINQGTLIPFSQVSAQGVQTTFQEARLQLMVRPHVTADGSIAMHVKINRDEPDFNQTSARGDPTILKREAETDLLVMDGHTVVIGGIYTRNTGRNLDQVPFFADIPVLGILFQRRRASDQRNELVIFLTPRIVNRAEALGR